MTDRLPGAPGRYSGVIAADQLQKLQKAEPFSITLTRDDAPIREGTPYSKAAVLPDDVAKMFCPERADATPADAFRTLGEGNLGASKDAFAAKISSFDGYKNTGGDLIQQEGCKVYRLMMEENEKLYGKTVRIKTYAYGDMVYGWHCHGEYIPINPDADIGEKPKSGIREFEVTFPEYNPEDVYEIFDVSFCENPYTDFEIYEKKGTVWEELKKLQSVEGYDAFESHLTAVRYVPQILTSEQQAQVRENIGFAQGVEETVSSCNSLVNSVLGETISVSDSLSRNLVGLRLYGKTTQDGTPTPDTPAALVSAGSSGSITVTVGISETDEDPQILTVATPNGLCGIPVPVTTSNDYIDENRQAWVCDEVDFERGVYIKRTNVADMGTLNWIYSSTYDYFYAVISGKSTTRVRVLSTAYKAANITDFVDKTIAGWYLYVPNGIHVRDKDFNKDAAAFKESVNGQMILYVLATPIEIPLSEEELASYRALHTNKPNTVIYTNDLAVADVKYVADTKTYIDNKFTELRNAVLATGANV